MNKDVTIFQDVGEDGDDEDKYAEDMDMPGQKFETKNRITVRNLRIREDTAKVSSVSASCLFSLVSEMTYFGQLSYLKLSDHFNSFIFISPFLCGHVWWQTLMSALKQNDNWSKDTMQLILLVSELCAVY